MVRVRGPSFKQEYQGGQTGRATRRAPSMCRGEASRFCIPEQAPGDRGKITLVLDLDETLVYAREGPLYARPGLDGLFKLCAEKCELVVWTAGLRPYAQAILQTIDKVNAVRHCIYRDKKWFTSQPGYQKDLKVLGRPLAKTIIIENTPDCIRGHENHGIIVEDYCSREVHDDDSTIPALTQVVRELCDAQPQKDVPQFLRECSLLRRARLPTDRGDMMEVYALDVGRWLQTPHVRINRDLAQPVAVVSVPAASPPQARV